MALSRTLCVFIFLLTTASWSYGQPHRYMVFFADKEGSTYSVSAPEEFLSAKAIARRSKQGIDVSAQDIPVIEAYVQGVKNTGAEVLYTTRWMNGALVQCDVSIIQEVEDLSYVTAVELVAPGGRPAGGGRSKSPTRKSTARVAAVTDTQLSRLGINNMHDAGYLGEGMTIAVIDAGFPGVDTAIPFEHIFTEGRLDQSVSYNFVYGDANVFQLDDHGTQVFSTIAAYSPGVFTGGAYKASYQLYITEEVSTEHHVEEYNWLFAAERADSAGADIISSSLGYNTFDSPSIDYEKTDLDGNTAVITRAAQWAAQRGLVVVVSAGNEGANSWTLVTAPADARDVLAVGAVNNQGVYSATSSTGPTADGRIKPDVVATGAGTAVVRPNGSTGSASGTSFSAPLVASLAAGVWQRYPHLTNLEVMDVIRQSASQAQHPDNFLGYGIPNFTAVVNKLEWTPQQKRIEVFPNPVADTLNIRPQSPEEISVCRAEITSLQGQLIADRVIAFNWLDRTYATDISTLSPGMYFLRIWLNQEVFSFKLVKQ